MACSRIPKCRFFPPGVSEHVDKGIVAVEKAAAGSGYVDTLLHLLKE